MVERGSLLGPEFSNDEIKAYLDSADAVYHYYQDDDDLVDQPRSEKGPPDCRPAFHQKPRDATGNHSLEGRRKPQPPRQRGDGHRTAAGRCQIRHTRRIGVCAGAIALGN